VKALIAGAGIGGLTAALCLNKAGIEVDIYESVVALKPLGVGINLLPHCTAVLCDLGLGGQLEETGIQTRAVEYRTKYGQLIHSDRRGVEAGFAFPQYSIHRGQLQQLLLQAVEQRLGPNTIGDGLALKRFSQSDQGVEAVFQDRRSGEEKTAKGDILIGADGFHSAVRKQLHPDEGPAHYEGRTLWRGANEQAPFGDGRTMFVAGNHDLKVVCYPISEKARRKGRALINWVAEVRDTGPGKFEEADWTAEGSRDFIPLYRDYRMPDIDLTGLFSNTMVINQYPMVDRDPLAWWSQGRVTLLGDAAHPMYPIGSNGAAQAILDGKALAASLAKGADPGAALGAYEDERREATAGVVLANRDFGPERVLDLANERVRGPDDRIEDLISAEEMEKIAKQYRNVAGFKKIAD
jgi:5-methylphenazine-1-carboxylate 1-monooxygenase